MSFVITKNCKFYHSYLLPLFLYIFADFCAGLISIARGYKFGFVLVGFYYNSVFWLGFWVDLVGQYRPKSLAEKTPHFG